MSPHKIDILPSPAALSSYGISKNGFLPADAPLSRLPHDYYQPWENIMKDLPVLIEKQQIRQRIDELPTLDTLHLDSEAEWQRAYSMLAVFTQGYVWTGPEPSERLPPAISIPFLEIAERLEVHPIATYAALNLWNWKPLEEGADLTQPENMVAVHTATGTDDESWFLIISNAMEARAGLLIHGMLAAMEAVERNDLPTIIYGLEYFKQSMVEIGKLLERMDERCNPQVFYHTIRPFLAGSMNMEAAGLPNGVFYDEGEGKGSWRKYRGGSNGQSSLLQFCDAVLSVNHSRCGGFHAEMRRYMPGPHARFLDDIEAIANIRSYVDNHQDNTELLAAFNEAVAALSGFRDKHIALVTRYIIIPSRMAKPAHNIKRTDIASASTKISSEKGQTLELRGTGGTKLIPFLRTSRDETSETAVAR
ncbi:Indoleamine 2,3-dioxygenase [Dothidotthia symphoricarpi CBS 119687]|uniref:Indoleamine 2,3-dioxygenase n=1 Tax=Dothidotthia symphoricarpi CBS 119687 TaxID=1392245 RepID=A0A6A6A1M9_9PLEO|nr:Indoleamine 2,3-dioxygenase [Dothidotthia symphoricarpi CBS 119687]KAF2124857.1 Indoleamine 2,3-dioxygenase [Dothidotthia symphoricarpi CBS 119687]